MARGRFHELRVSTVDGDACNFLFTAEILVALSAKFALPARPVHPGNTHTGAEVQIIYRDTFVHNATRNFVPEYEWHLGDGDDLRPIAIGDVQIRMADAAPLHFDQHFVRVRLRFSSFLNRQWMLQFV